MKIRTILGLAAIGGAAYAHKQRGGTFTLDSLKQSGRALATGLVGQAMKAMGPARTTAANTSQASPNDTTGGSSTYGVGTRRFDDDNLH